MQQYNIAFIYIYHHIFNRTTNLTKPDDDIALIPSRVNQNQNDTNDDFGFSKPKRFTWKRSVNEEVITWAPLVKPQLTCCGCNCHKLWSGAMMLVGATTVVKIHVTKSLFHNVWVAAMS